MTDKKQSITEQAKGFYKKHKTLIYLVLVVLLFLLPTVVTKNSTRGILCRVLMYTILAGSLNVINGYSGQFSLGHAGFFCIGAYVEAILATRFGFNFFPLLLLSGITAAIVGVLVCLPTLRLQGIYLSFVTIGFSEVIRIIALNWTKVTNGAQGIKNIPTPSAFGFAFKGTGKFYYIFLVVAVTFVFCTNRVINSRIGRAWMSLREDTAAARSLAVKASWYKATNFAYGAFWAGVAGALYSPYMKYIESTVFSLDEGFKVLSMVVVGGMGTLGGPIVGSVIITMLTEGLRFAGLYRMVLYSILIIAIMWIRPQGLFGASDSVLSGGKRLFKKKKGTAEGKEDRQE